MTLHHNIAGDGERVHKGGLLLGGSVELGRDVPLRDEWRVARGDGEAVPEPSGELVLVKDSFRQLQVAEWAGLVAHVRRPLAVGRRCG